MLLEVTNMNINTTTQETITKTNSRLNNIYQI
jgi:hypothetical protein